MYIWDGDISEIYSKHCNWDLLQRHLTTAQPSEMSIISESALPQTKLCFYWWLPSYLSKARVESTETEALQEKQKHVIALFESQA